jgi:hypothetical protein
LHPAGAVRLAAQQARQHTPRDMPAKRRAMDQEFECDGGLSGTSARACRLAKILRTPSTGTWELQKSFVNNNPETMKVPRRSFHTAAGWCFAQTKHP